MAGTKVRNLSQTATIRASPMTVYETLVRASEHAKFTGASARLEAKVGGRFEHYDGSLSGVVVALDPGKRIVLAWRSSEWPEGHHSIADFTLRPVAGGTKVEFAQYGIPASDFDDIADGWRTYYWRPLQAYLGT
jgi:activator of HSP90 ATPase